MSFTKPETLPKPIQQALNQIAHSRALLYQATCRDQIRKEIDTLLASGMSHKDAIEALRAGTLGPLASDTAPDRTQRFFPLSHFFVKAELTNFATGVSAKCPDLRGIRSFVVNPGVLTISLFVNSDVSRRGSKMTHQEQFAEACKVTDFEAHPQTVGGYKVWGVSDIVKGGRQQFDGPYFTQAEAAIAAELWGVTSDRRFARAEASIHCAAWNPDPAREVAIREDALAARMILAELLGAQIPKPHASRL